LLQRGNSGFGMERKTYLPDKTHRRSFGVVANNVRDSLAIMAIVLLFAWASASALNIPLGEAPFGVAYQIGLVVAAYVAVIALVALLWKSQESPPRT
jgi:hypothetical protein